VFCRPGKAKAATRQTCEHNNETGLSSARKRQLSLPFCVDLALIPALSHREREQSLKSAIFWDCPAALRLRGPTDNRMTV
ncbi:hypothetical protein, partial [Klebsiella quasipneumoniae]|uniref:hypothetical protein n=1 Tax=Klebsiella quasipneumoniae TaxID=1463165 RepID=UPI001CCF31D7